MKSVLLLFSLFLVTTHLVGAEFSQDVPCEAKVKQPSPKPVPVIASTQIVAEPKRPLTDEEKITLEAYLKELLSNPLKKQSSEFDLRCDYSYDRYLGQSNERSEVIKFYTTQLKPVIHMQFYKFAASKTQNEWEELFKNNAHNFIKQYSENYPQLLPILINPKMLKQILNLGKFTIKNAEDVEHVVIDN